MKDKALKMLLSLKVKQSLMQIIGDEVKLDCAKTKSADNLFSVFLRSGKKTNKGLFVADFSDKKKALGFRNLQYVRWLPVKGLNILDLVNFRYLILTEGSLDKLTEHLISK